MKTNLITGLRGAILAIILIAPVFSYGQKNSKNSDAVFIDKYLKVLPRISQKNSNDLLRYRMTAIYTNRDIYGNFMDKQKVSGEYTRGLENGFVSWNNIYVSGSNNFSEPFPAGKKQEYMENLKYVPSPKMLDASAFVDFPAGTESVFAKNLVWDMMAIEGFAWDYTDSLKLNTIYRIPEIKGEFNMADIGTYSHTEIQICWTGISSIHNEICAVIDYRALDNKIEMKMEGFKTKGTEQYWGTTWLSLKTGMIESAVMYGGTIQEIEVSGMTDKFLIKTVRELWVDKIQ
jgi:hypothetical protein